MIKNSIERKYNNKTSYTSALLVKWSACLSTDHEVAGSIPDTSTNFKCVLVWNGVHPGS